MSELFEYRRKLLAALAAQPEMLIARLRAVPEAEWHLHHDAQGHTIHMLAAHMRDLEALAILPRLRRILLEDDPRLDAFQNHRWSVANHDPAESLSSILTAWRQAREDVVQVLWPVPETAWVRRGFHPPSGWRTLQWWAERAYTHAREHVHDLQRSLATPVQLNF
jgi:hypothetical protein